MNMKKVKAWLDLANQCGGKEFWEDLLDEEPGAVPIEVDTGADEAVAAGSANVAAAQSGAWKPAMDLLRVEGYTVVLVELPGVRREELELLLEGDTLVLKGTKINRYAAVETLASERYAGRFERRIRLPHLVEWNRVHAAMADGVLTIRLPQPPPYTAKIPIG